MQQRNSLSVIARAMGQSSAGIEGGWYYPSIVVDDDCNHLGRQLRRWRRRVRVRAHGNWNSGWYDREHVGQHHRQQQPLRPGYDHGADRRNGQMDVGAGRDEPLRHVRRRYQIAYAADRDVLAALRAAGTCAYECTLDSGMNGTVTVRYRSCPRAHQTREDISMQRKQFA